MRKAFALALLLAIGGCSKTAVVALSKDSHGKLASTRIVRSSGVPDFDWQAISVESRFPRVVAKPVANHVYTQPVVIKVPATL